jgi:hypothetical protein
MDELVARQRETSDSADDEAGQGSRRADDQPL